MTEIILKLTPGELEDVLRSIRFADSETPSKTYSTDLVTLEAKIEQQVLEQIHDSSGLKAIGAEDRLQQQNPCHIA